MRLQPENGRYKEIGKLPEYSALYDILDKTADRVYNYNRKSNENNRKIKTPAFHFTFLSRQGDAA